MVEDVPTVLHPYALRVLYGSQTGTAKKFAERIASQAKAAGVDVTLVADIKDCDPEDTLTHEVRREHPALWRTTCFFVFVVVVVACFTCCVLYLSVLFPLL